MVLTVRDRWGVSWVEVPFCVLFVVETLGVQLEKLAKLNFAILVAIIDGVLKGGSAHANQHGGRSGEAISMLQG